MTDGSGREIDYLRISLTDKCNLRCEYCMPKEGIRHLEHKEVLSLEEFVRIAGILSELGIKRVRLTGGEPLVKKGLTDLVRMLHHISPGLDICMTTNGSLLSGCAHGLKIAGLRSVNVSLDTLDPVTFKTITGSDDLKSVLDGIGSAVDEGFEVRLNSVILRGINEDDVIPLTEYASKTGVDLRFIELMPIGCGVRFEGIPSDELVKILEDRYGISQEVDSDSIGTGRGPAVYRRFAGYPGRIGFISPLSHGFCERCNRIRLTSAGFLKLCLEHPDGIDLKSSLRSGAGDDEIKEMIRQAILRKPAAHRFAAGGSAEDDRKMFQIGG